jgi:DNA repair exonuclease SbcCD nuclease subunit
MKFLHIADVHLGCTRYQLAESPGDFFDAWQDVLQRYAIGERVDFVIMCGDFFHKRSVPPETMNHAVAGLGMLRDAGIPVVTIEGNHDQRHGDSEYSWLRSLSDWGLLHLLEPHNEAGRITYRPWDADSRRGGFIDIGRARIFGSHWYGVTTNLAVPMLTRAIAENRRDGAFHILLLHTDVEGHQMHPVPALSMNALKELRAVTDYVGLGHTHKHYEIENWAFNPGSIEITNIAEFRETRGVFVVEVGEDNAVSATHHREFRHRPFQRLQVDVTNYSTPAEVTAAALAEVDRSSRIAEAGAPAPIVEIALTGSLGFPNSQIETQKIRDRALGMTGALHVRIKNHSIPAEYVEVAGGASDVDREVWERRVVADLIARDKRYKTKAEPMANAIIGAKKMALGDDEPEKIAEFIALAAVPGQQVRELEHNQPIK